MGLRTASSRALLALVWAAVVGAYAWRCSHYVSELGDGSAAAAYYNRLVDGFSSGQLHLKVEVPPLLRQLPDPWDPATNRSIRGSMYASNRLHDTSYYQGKIFLYFGPTPALVLFWPFRAVTGSYLSHSAAVAIFSSFGFTMVTALWLAIWRRYYSKVPAIVVAGGLAALGLATSVPLLLARPDVWEVPISCAYALVMLMLGALWRALHDSTRRTVWLAVAASALGLAIGARPWLVLACPALLVPAVTGAGSIGVPGRRRRLLTDLVAIGLPLAAIGLCLALYNLRRFDSIFEFGQRYQLAEDRQDAARHFSLTYLWFNFRVYFLSVATWDSRFPFVTGVSSLPPPAGHAEVDQPFGLLTNTPVTAFALYLLLRGRESFRTRPAELRAFVGIVAGVFAVGAVTLCLFYGTCTRYQVEFHPALTLLAALGGLAWISSTQGSRASRRAITTLWLATVAASVIVESLRSWHGRVDQLVARAAALETERRPFQALSLYQEAIRSSPDRVDLRYQAALLLEELGMTSAAITEHEALLQVDPFHVGGCNRLGRLLANARRGAEAVRLFHRVVGMQPQYPEAHFNLGLAFQLENRHGEAIRCFEETLRLRPGFPLAHRQRAISLQAAAVPRP